MVFDRKMWDVTTVVRSSYGLGREVCTHTKDPHGMEMLWDHIIERGCVLAEHLPACMGTFALPGGFKIIWLN